MKSVPSPLWPAASLVIACAVAHLHSSPANRNSDANWPAVGNDRGGMRYSTLTQINRGNVKNLKVAWTYSTGELDPEKKTTIECTPLIVDGVMYVTTIYAKVVALDDATGKELWKFDPYGPFKSPEEWRRANGNVPIASGGVNRGVAFWSEGVPLGKKRVLLGAPDGRLISLDANTGQPDPEFGLGGTVHVREGIEWDCSRFPYGATSAPAVYKNFVIMGFSASEGPPPGAPGDVRAFDVRTGKEAWRFHTVPREGEFGYDTWPPNQWRGRSGVNPWGGLTVDETRGMVLFGTGSAAFDFYGGDRKGHNLFANCTIALDANTGKRLWHFQTLHHDLWDHDLPCPPVLGIIRRPHPFGFAQGRPRPLSRLPESLSLPIFRPKGLDDERERGAGVRVDIAAQVTKTGYCFVFDRLTGKPIYDVIEKPVPTDALPGEFPSPTQPVPLRPPPFSKVSFTKDDVTNISTAAHDFILGRLKTLKYGPELHPPSFEGTVTTPGFHGGATWSGASMDPTTGILYVNSNNMPNVITMKKTENPAAPYTTTGYNKFLDQEGYPAIKPPWGMLNAIDLNKGDFAWRSLLGEFPELTARGIPQTGTENFGGTIVTAGGVVFIGATMDEKFHAFDKATGKLLWECKLPAGGYATPSTYAVNGKQYVVIAAGGGGKLGTKSGDMFVAFAVSN